MHLYGEANTLRSGLTKKLGCPFVLVGYLFQAAIYGAVLFLPEWYIAMMVSPVRISIS